LNEAAFGPRSELRGAGHEPIFSAKSERSAFEARVETVMHEPPPGTD